MNYIGWRGRIITAALEYLIGPCRALLGRRSFYVSCSFGHLSYLIYSGNILKLRIP